MTELKFFLKHLFLIHSRYEKVTDDFCDCCRSIQKNMVEWNRWYDTEADRLQHLMFSKTSSSIADVALYTKTLAVTSMFVFPKQTLLGDTYIAMHMIIEGSTSTRITVCGRLDLARFVSLRGNNDMTVLSVCELGNFFENMLDLGYVPVVFTPTSDNIPNIDIALVPTLP